MNKIPTEMWNVTNWCRKTGISLATFYRHEDSMPRTIKIGRSRLITLRAEREWEDRMRERSAAESNGG